MKRRDGRSFLAWRKLLLGFPLLVMFLAAWPSISYQLPACQSDLGEDYQPLDTLRFFHTRGEAFQRYGVFPNFLLAPGYGLSLVGWKMTGKWNSPTSDFPYGFAEPLEQMGFLLWQGRWLFLLLGLTLLAYHLFALYQWLPRPIPLLTAYGICLATNPIVGLHLANTRPDGIALCLTACALSLYHQMAIEGMTNGRAFWFSLVAVAALSSKELAAFMFVLPCLALSLLQLLNRQRADSKGTHSVSLIRRCGPVAVLLVTGCGAYAIINIVYAPSAWWERMQYWLGQGADKEVFSTIPVGAYDATFRFLSRVLASVANNIGPGGLFVVPVGLGMVLVRRPRHALLMSLPLLSVSALFLLPLGYAQDRYYMYVALGFVAPVTLGWETLLQTCSQSAVRFGLWALLLISILANASYLPFAWVALPMRAPYLIERDALTRASETESVYLLTYDPGSQPPGKHRLAMLGVNWDPRSLQAVMNADEHARPMWIYAHAGAESFIDGAPERPARAEYLRTMSQFDCREWRGVAAMGYRVDDVLVPPIPRWFPWGMMPAVSELQQLERVTVYRRINRN